MSTIWRSIERADHRLRLAIVAIATVALLAFLFIVMSAGEAEAWDSSTITRSTSYYRTGDANERQTQFDSGGFAYRYYKNSDYSPEVQYYQRDFSTYTDRYTDKAYLGFYVGSYNDLTYINSATLSITVSPSAGLSNIRLYAKVLENDPYDMGPQGLFDEVSTPYTGYSLGYRTVTSTTTSLSWTISGSAAYELRSQFSKDWDYLYIGFYGSAMALDEGLTISTGSLTLSYDASSPYTPTLNDIPRYTSSSSTRVSWGAVSDRPSPGRGVTSYQVGVFSSSSTADLLYTLAWTSYTYDYIHNAPEAQVLYIRVRAQDLSGIMSGWSGYDVTEADYTPPTVPIPFAEPTFTSGTGNQITWSPSSDGPGSGLRSSPDWIYQVQTDTNPTFPRYTLHTTRGTYYTFSSLVDGQTYYYRVRARDDVGYYSDWGPTVSTTMDNAAPSPPEMMAEPVHSPGTINTFNWHPSTDAGVGVDHYYYWVANDPSFGPGTVVASGMTSDTFVTVGNLLDGTTYYARVTAYDHFGHYSVTSAIVSSTQDASGPTAPGFQPLAEFSPNSTLTLHWNGSVDEGVGVGWYNVEWSNVEDFSANVTMWDHVLGHTLRVAPPEAGMKWYFRVTPYDLLGFAGGAEVMNTTIDGIAPTAPVIDPEPEYTMGDSNSVSWAMSTDDLSGMDHYMVRVFARAGSGLVFMDTTTGLSMDVPGLANGASYWYQVTAVDAAGNANASALVMSTQDASAPTLPHTMGMPMFTVGTTAAVEWRPSIDTGSGGVQYMLEWSTDPTFAMVTDATAWMAGTTYDVMDLMDGSTYHFRVKARDALDQESMWGEMAMTTMDASAPPVPVMMAPVAIVRGPVVEVMWGPVVDGSGQMVEYQVMAYDTADMGMTPVDTSPWLRDTAFGFLGLPPNMDLFFRVVARDPFGWVSDLSEPVTTLVDGMGPSAGSLGDIPEYTGGSGLTVAWTVGEDAGIGGVAHRLVVYADVGLSIPVHTPEWTGTTQATVSGLVDGATYWFVLESRDAFGNMGEVSEPASTTMDMSSPVLAADKAVFGSPDGAVSGTCEDATSGVALVEASGDGGDNWVEADLDDDEWTVPLGDLPTGTTHVMVRASDAVGNMLMEYIMVEVDTSAPVITINLPTDGSDVSGAVVVLGSISDANLLSYIVEVQASGASTWTVVQPTQATTMVAGTLATWVTAGLAGGDYTLRVTASDAMGKSSEATVDVVLKGAHLSIGPGDITFSDTHPLPGDKVTVMVTVRNDGDSPAEGVTVVVSDGGTEVGRLEGVTVPAHGVAVVPVEMKAEGEHDISARASSDLYDTGVMSTGQPLNTIEEESTLENAGGVLGLVALILAVLAIVLAILLSRKGGEPASTPIKDEDVIIDPVMEDVPYVEPEPLPAPVPEEQLEGPGT